MIKSIASCISECWHNRRRLLAVSIYNFKFQFNQTKLNLIWAILNPLLQALTYWFVFHIGMRTNSPVDGVSYLTWMLTGLLPWFYISFVLQSGVNSIVAARGIICNMAYPTSIIPVCTVLTEFISHLFFMAVLIAIQLVSGVRYGLQTFGVLYYMVAGSIFLIGFTFLFSTITVYFRDMQKFMALIVKLLFFITPICWVNQGELMESIQKWNPLTYIIEGYRSTMLYNELFPQTAFQHGYFWLLTLLMLVVGIHLHMKLRSGFVDVL